MAGANKRQCTGMDRTSYGRPDPISIELAKTPSDRSAVCEGTFAVAVLDNLAALARTWCARLPLVCDDSEDEGQAGWPAECEGCGGVDDVDCDEFVAFVQSGGRTSHDEPACRHHCSRAPHGNAASWADEVNTCVECGIGGTAPSPGAIELCSALVGVRGRRLLHQGIEHSDARVASTCLRVLSVLVRGTPSAMGHQSLWPLLRRSVEQAGPSKGSEERAASAVRAAAMQVAADMLVACRALASRPAALAVDGDADWVERASSVVAEALPTVHLLSSLADPSLYVAEAARALTCTILAGREATELRACLLPALQSWMALRLPTGGGPVAASWQTAASLVLRRGSAQAEEMDCAEHHAIALVLSPAQVEEIDCAEHAIALVSALLDCATSSSLHKPTADAAASCRAHPCEELLRSWSLLGRCARLLPMALLPHAPPATREQLLGLVTKACSAGEGGVAQLLPSSASCEDGGRWRRQHAMPQLDEPVEACNATSGVQTDLALAELAALAETLLGSECVVGALRLLGACRPAQAAAPNTASCGVSSAHDMSLPPPVVLSLRVMHMCLSCAPAGCGTASSQHAPGSSSRSSPSSRSSDPCQVAESSSTAWDAKLHTSISARLYDVLLYTLLAAEHWASTDWLSALLAAGWIGLLASVVEATGGATLEPSSLSLLPSSQRANLLDVSCRVLALVFARDVRPSCSVACDDRAQHISEARRLAAVLASALSIGLHDCAAPPHGSAGSSCCDEYLGASRSIYTSCTLLGSLTALSHWWGAAERAAGPSSDLWVAGYVRDALSCCLRAACTCPAAPVRHAAVVLLDVLVARPAGASFALQDGLTALLLSHTSSPEDTPTRAAAMRALAALASTPEGWATLTAQRADWLRDLMQAAFEAEAQPSLAVAGLEGLHSAVRHAHSRECTLQEMGTWADLHATELEPPGSSFTPRLGKLWDTLGGSTHADVVAAALALVSTLQYALACHEPPSGAHGLCEALKATACATFIRHAPREAEARESASQLGASPSAPDDDGASGGRQQVSCEPQPATRFFFGPRPRRHECE